MLVHPGRLRTPYKRSLVSLLLDLYPNAAAAYSLRKLRTDYAGSAIRVRRSSDDAEQDIGFDGTDLDESALTTFVGAGNGNVVTWYDQSENGYDVTNATAARQPIIATSGSVITDNGSPAVQFTNAGHYLVSSISETSTAVATFFCVLQNTENDDRSSPIALLPVGGSNGYQGLAPFNFRSSTPDWPGCYYGDGSSFEYYTQDGDINDEMDLFTYVRPSATEMSWYQRGSLVQARDPATDLTVNADRIVVGTRDIVAQEHTGNISEVIYYASDQSSNRAAIESAINTYYSIY